MCLYLCDMFSPFHLYVWRRLIHALTGQMDLQQLIRIIPELHLNQAELLEVCAQFKGPEYGIFFSQHDQRGAGQAAVNVQAKPDPRVDRGDENI